jgi:hypothetical protein
MKIIIENATNCCEDYEWEDLIDVLDHKITNKKSTTGFWYAVVENFGWRRVSGSQYFKANSFSEILSRILPNTACTFNVNKEGRTFKIQNFHHDSCDGSEWYTIKPISEKKFLAETT